jgi:hypothetical protein
MTALASIGALVLGVVAGFAVLAWLSRFVGPMF